VAELTATVTHAELVEWAEYYGLEPWGEAPADLRAGIIASTVANCHRAADSDPLTPMDFMPRARAEAADHAPIDESEEAPMTMSERNSLRRAVLFGIRPQEEHA
jgi:hypothetical protein